MRVECESLITFNGFVYLVMAWLLRETLEQSIPYKKSPLSVLRVIPGYSNSM